MTLNQIVEALLFASPEPLTLKAIAKIIRDVSKRGGGNAKLVRTTPEDIATAVADLNDAYAKDGVAFAAEERANGWKLYSRIEYGDYVRELFPDHKPSRLSHPALETLAIIAYRQPLTKAAIEAVRGVMVDGVLHTLIERGLVRVGGRADLPGRPLLYETSEIFLEHFGIKAIDDLPNAAELRQVALPEPESEASPVEEQLPLAGVDEGEETEVDVAADTAGETTPEPSGDPDGGDAEEPSEKE